MRADVFEEDLKLKELEEKFLATLLRYPDLVFPNVALSGVKPSDFSDELNKIVFRLLYTFWESGAWDKLFAFLDELKGEEKVVAEKINSLFKESTFDAEEACYTFKNEILALKFIKRFRELNDEIRKNFHLAVTKLFKVIKESEGMIAGEDDELKLGFPEFEKKTLGLIPGLYLVAGGTGTGKTSFVLQLAWQIVSFNKDVSVLVVSFDSTSDKVYDRIIAQMTRVSWERVRLSDFESEISRMKVQRARRKVAKLGDRFTVWDERNFGMIELNYFLNRVATWRAQHPGRAVVVVDPVNMIRVERSKEISINETLEVVIRDFKSFATLMDVSIVAVANVSDVGVKRPSLKSFSSTPSLLYLPHVVIAAYCDFLNNPETELLEWEWGTEDVMVPIVEMKFIKNKLTGFSDTLFYRYWGSAGYFKECAIEEMENYREMIKNLEYHRSLKQERERKDKVGKELNLD